jgi:hypothetical protein
MPQKMSVVIKSTDKATRDHQSTVEGTRDQSKHWWKAGDSVFQWKREASQWPPNVQVTVGNQCFPTGREDRSSRPKALMTVGRQCIPMEARGHQPVATKCTDKGKSDHQSTDKSTRDHQSTDDSSQSMLSNGKREVLVGPLFIIIIN